MPAQLNSFTHLRAQWVLHARGGGEIASIASDLCPEEVEDQTPSRPSLDPL
jgi:hypothetical protein